MAVEAFEENGAIRKNFVEIFFVRQGFGAEHGVIPAATENPICAGMFCGVFAESRLNVDGIFGPFEVDATETEGAVEKMNVRIGETWKNQAASGVNYFCSRRAKASEVFIGADGDDSAMAKGDGLCPGLFGVDGVNLGGKNGQMG